MSSRSSKFIGVKDYESTFTIQEKVDFFCKDINFPGMSDEAYVILEPCYEDERVNTTSPTRTQDKLFYLYILIIHELWMLIIFTLFKSEA